MRFLVTGFPQTQFARALTVLTLAAGTLWGLTSQSSLAAEPVAQAETPAPAVATAPAASAAADPALADLSKLEQQCKAGDVTICAAYGHILLVQAGQAKEPAQAVSLSQQGLGILAQACDKDNAQACYDFGAGLSIFAPQNDSYAAMAHAAFGKACDLGSAKGCGMSGGYGDVPPEEAALALKRAEKGCELGSASSCINAGYFYRDPGNIYREQKDLHKVVPVFRRACELDASTCGSLALAYAAGLGTDVSQEEADVYYAKACNAGSASDCQTLAERLEQGIFVQQDLVQSQHFYAKACELYGSDPLDGSCLKAEQLRK